MELSFRRWLEAGGDSFPTPFPEPGPALAQLKDTPGKGCDTNTGGIPCVTLGGKDEEDPNLPPKMRKMKKQKK